MVRNIVNRQTPNPNNRQVAPFQPFMPLSRDERSYTAGSALTWVRGPHQLRAGIDVVRHELNHFAADSSFAGLRGGFQFGGLVTGTPGHGARLEQHTCANAPIGLSTAVY